MSVLFNSYLQPSRYNRPKTLISNKCDSMLQSHTLANICLDRLFIARPNFYNMAYDPKDTNISLNMSRNMTKYNCKESLRHFRIVSVQNAIKHEDLSVYKVTKLVIYLSSLDLHLGFVMSGVSIKFRHNK